MADRIATVLSKTERLLLYLERLSIVEYNRLVDHLRGPGNSDHLVPIVNALSLITFEAEAFFRVRNMSHYLKLKSFLTC